MKVIHIAGGGDCGGAKTHIISLCSHLSETCELMLVSLRSGDFAESAKAAGINTRVIYSSSTLRDYSELVKYIRAEKPDIVHCHGAKANLAGVFVKLFCRATIITTVHSDYRLDYMHSAVKRNTIGRLNTAALRCFDYYVTVSDLFKDMLISRRFPANRIMTIYNGLDFERKAERADRASYLRECGLDYSPEDVVVGIPARLNPVKDISTLIRAFAKAKAKNPHLKLLIGGDGEEMDNLKALVSSLGISESVAFLGWVHDVPRFFTVCDIDVLCSISESFPYSVLEGIRENCAVITSDVGGMRKLIDNGENGYIFRPGDIDTFAGYILDLSRDAAKRDRFAKLLYKKASSLYSISQMVKTQLNIYESINKLKKAKDSGVLICGAYGRGNSGDEAILKAIIDSVRALNPLLPITVMTRAPMETSLKHCINTVFTFNLFSFLRIMRKSSLFINGGGNLIQDSTSSRSLYFYLFTIAAAKKLGCRVIMYGCGIGRVKRPRNRRLTRKIIDKYVDTVTLRDRFSLHELEDMEISKPRIILSADPAMSITPAPMSDADYYLRRSELEPGGKFICFSLREWGDFKNYSAFADAAAYAYEKYGLMPVFLPIETPKDSGITDAVISLLRCPYRTLEAPSDASLLISVFGKMTAVCAMRLHALVFAAASGAPFFAASYDIKVDGFMDYCGRSDFCRELKSADADWLRACVDKIMAGDSPASPAEMFRELEKNNSAEASTLLHLR